MFYVFFLFLNLTSILFATDADFERGFHYGREACRDRDFAWYCFVEKDIRSFCNDDSLNSGFGATRSEAILKISLYCRTYMMKHNISPTCVKI